MNMFLHYVTRCNEFSSLKVRLYRFFFSPPGEFRSWKPLELSVGNLNNNFELNHSSCWEIFFSHRFNGWNMLIKRSTFRRGPRSTDFLHPWIPHRRRMSLTPWQESTFAFHQASVVVAQVHTARRWCESKNGRINHYTRKYPPLPVASLILIIVLDALCNVL